MRRRIAMGLVLAIAPSGCAGRTPDAPEVPTSAHQTPDAAPESSETPLARTGLTPPEPIFGGDCSRLFTDAEMTAIAGENVEPFVYEDNEPGTPLHRQLGVITCDWVGADSTAIALTVLHNEFAPDVPEQKCGAFPSGENMFNQDLCVLDVESHGVRIGGAVYWSTHDESRVIADRLVAAFHDSDLSEHAGQVPVPLAGSWDARVICEELAPLTVDGVEYRFGTEIMGSDGSVLPVDDAISAGTPTSNGCFAKTADSDPQFSFTSMGGAAWRYDEMLDLNYTPGQRPEAAEVPGFDFGFRAGDTLFLVSGPNYLSVWTGDGTDDSAVAVSVKALLDSMAVPS